MASEAASGASTRLVLYAGAAVMVALIGLADQRTGSELSFSIFYLVPVGLVALHGSGRAAILFAIVSALTWLAVDASTRSYSHPAIAFWNAFVRLGFFVLVAATLARLSALVTREKAMATTDYLTQLANSRAFYAELEREVQRTRRNAQPLTVSFLDLDNFKAVNDRSGHLVGDQLLRLVAKHLVTKLRAIDMVARLGGDEFAILLPDTSAEEARISLERIRAALEEEMRTHDWPVTASVGAVTATVAPSNSEQLVKLADEQMYRAKHSGKNRLFVAEYQAPDDPKTLERTPDR